MGIIRKQISIDKCRSHKKGLLPFVQYESGIYIYSGITSNNSNYGHYVCDLAIKISGETKDNITYNQLIDIPFSSLSIGDKYLVTDEAGRQEDFTYTPQNTVYMWDGKRWVFFIEKIKYLDVIEKYNEISQIVNDLIFCKCIKTVNNKLVLKKCLNETNNCENLENNVCDGDLYNYIPVYRGKLAENNDFYIPIASNLELIPNQYYVIIDDYATYNDCEYWGGNYGLSAETKFNSFTFKKYVDNNIINSSNVSNDFFLVPPHVDIPLLLEQECTYDTIYFPYEYTLEGNEIENITLNNEVYSAKVGTNIVLFSDLYSDNNTINGTLDKVSGLPATILCESKLDKLKHYSAYDITEDFCGILSGWVKTETISALTIDDNIQVTTNTYNNGKMFKCKHYLENVDIENGVKKYPLLKNSNVYQVIIDIESDTEIGWWECIAIDDNELSGYVCYDGINIIEGSNGDDDKKYRNVVFLNCIPTYEPTPDDGYYYFKAQYQNGKINPPNGALINEYESIVKMSYPFIVGEPVNIETYTNDVVIYDMVLNANVTIYDDNVAKCEVNYVLGATSGVSGTGIFYSEILDYNSGVTKDVWIDGVCKAELWYETLNYNSNSYVYHHHFYNADFLVREANIIDMEISSLPYINYPLFTKEGSEFLYNEPNIKYDILFNRGVGAAYEKHFKLAECNTFQDLKKYGNNIFNL